jgi:hypothetical protein
VNKTFTFFVVSGTFAAIVAFGCGDSDSADSGTALPGRGTEDAGSTKASCTSLALQVSDTPACDKCAKDKCCSEVLACDDSADCKGLQNCIAKCASNDFQCLLTCQAAHDKGSNLLQDLGSCASDQCKTECPDQTLDADIFGDF